MDLQGINFDDVMEESSVAEEGQGFTKLNTAPDNWGFVIFRASLPPN